MIDVFRYLCGRTKQVKFVGILYALANTVGG